MSTTQGEPLDPVSRQVPPHRREFGAYLRQARENTGRSQQEVAEAIGISPAMLSHAESGRRVLGDEKLRRLADALGLDPNDIERRRAVLSGQDQHYRVQRLASELPPPEGQATRLPVDPAATRGTRDSVEMDGADPRAASIGIFLEQLRHAMVHGSADTSHAASRVELLALILQELRTLTVPELASARAFIQGIKAAEDLRRPAPPQPPAIHVADTRLGPSETTTAEALAIELGLTPETVIRKAAAQFGITISPTTPINVELADYIREAYRRR